MTRESGLYYLQSRYYDPETGRFVNADAQLCTSLGILGTNQFAYCLNNPINLTDFTGNKPDDFFGSVDDAAIDAAIYLGRRSFLFGWEYATSIYSVEVTTTKIYRNKSYHYNNDGSLQVSIQVTFAEVTLKTYTYSSVWTDYNAAKVVPPLAPDGYELKAFVHTHPLGSRKGITAISPPDILLAQEYNVIMFVHGPNGQLLKYTPTTEDIMIFEGLPEAWIKHWKYYKGAW